MTEKQRLAIKLAMDTMYKNLNIRKEFRIYNPISDESVMYEEAYDILKDMIENEK